MPQSQSLSGLGLSSYKRCACFRRNKMQSFRTSYSTCQHQTIQGIFLAFLSVSYLQEGKASWPMCFHLMSVDYKKALPLFLTPLAKMSLPASAGDKWQQSYLSLNVPANLLNTTFLIWHIGQVLAPEEKYVHLCASDGTETLLSYCQSPAEREPHWPVRRKKCYFYLVAPQDATDRIGSAVWTWKCAIKILWADVGA